MADLNKIIEDLSKLTVVEAAELSKQLEEKWGVTAATTAVTAPVSSGAAAPAEEQSEFTIMLTAAGDKKISVIKEKVKSGVNKKEAEEIKKKLEAAGAKVELK